MKQVLIQRGQIVVDEVPVPTVEPGTVLVRVDHSCISVGTEMSGVSSAGTPLWKKALQKPRTALKLAEMVATHGVNHTRAMVRGHLAAAFPTGYSAAGTVVEVGEGIDDLEPGDRVACAGAQCAHHAEYIRPPRNLVVRIPDSVSFAHASTVTLGAIALQGVRRARPTMGETFVVVGLGLLGQLVCQLLKANGCRVIGTDLDATRVDLAGRLGMDVSLNPDADDTARQVARLTDGMGADGVIITAASKSDAILSGAFQMCRKKGRVVVVGDVGLKIDRADIYAKELDFFISTSYGPGRYDRGYEERGLDYPAAYVRWTENRNMAEYLRLIEARQVKLQPLIHTSYAIDDAARAYESLKASEDGQRPLMVLLSYPVQEDETPRRVVPNIVSRPSRPGQIRLAVVGAGAFAQGMHLPNLQQLPRQFVIEAIVSRTAHNATSVSRQFQARYATTDYREVLRDPEIDAVLITTRHHQHAEMARDALRVGKHVLVEKPLAMTPDELDSIVATLHPSRNTAQPVLMTGFNRRFSPHLKRAAEIVQSRSNPMIINYRMNAGYLPLDLWYHGPEGGGRNIGEACHIYDLFVYLTNSRAVHVSAQSIRPGTAFYSHSDNFVTTISFEDGSVATLTYTALGASEFPKESMEVFVDGQVLAMDNYRSLKIHGSRARGIETRTVDKGHLEELKAFAAAVQGTADWPIPLWQQTEATEISFRVEQLLQQDRRTRPTTDGNAHLRRAS